MLIHNPGLILGSNLFYNLNRIRNIYLLFRYFLTVTDFEINM